MPCLKKKKKCVLYVVQGKNCLAKKNVLYCISKLPLVEMLFKFFFSVETPQKGLRSLFLVEIILLRKNKNCFLMYFKRKLPC